MCACVCVCVCVCVCFNNGGPLYGQGDVPQKRWCKHMPSRGLKRGLARISLLGKLYFGIFRRLRDTKNSLFFLHQSVSGEEPDLELYTNRDHSRLLPLIVPQFTSPTQDELANII